MLLIEFSCSLARLTNDDQHMGLVKTRRLAAMQKQQRAKAGIKPLVLKSNLKTATRKDKRL